MHTYTALITDPIGESEARFIARDWHSGQGSALYSFASSGHLDVDGALSEARESMRYDVATDEATDDLMHLIDYLERQQPPEGQYLHTFEPGSLVHLIGDPVGRDYSVVSHGVSASLLRQELPTGYAERSFSCWRRATAT